VLVARRIIRNSLPDRSALLFGLDLVSMFAVPGLMIYLLWI
jgi:hypothetical protein